MAYPKPLLDRQTRLRLLEHLWSDPHLLGALDTPEKFGESWQRGDSLAVEEGSHHYGCIQITAQEITGCESMFLPDSDQFTWFALCIPLGMLEPIFPVYYPLTFEENKIWTEKVDAAFAAIGARIYAHLPFILATVGEEASAPGAEEILAHLSTGTGLLVPEKLFRERQVPPRGMLLQDGLRWIESAAG